MDTLAFFKGRAVPLGIAMTGLIAAFLYNHYRLHTQAALIALELGLVSIGSSYGIFFLGSLIVNTVKAPWLLDAESGQQIDALETRALLAEGKAKDDTATKHENRRLHDLFGSFMQVGIDLSSDLVGCRNFEWWDNKFDSWLLSVKNAISDMGFSSEAAEFTRAGENAEPIVGIRDLRNEREERCRVLEQHQQKLEEIVHRRLP
jgi:hypothetical protein